MKNINFEKVLLKIGGVADDTTSYDSIRSTWNSELSTDKRCPSPKTFMDVWHDMVFSGEETGTWEEERIKAYIKEGIFIERTNDLLMEYNLAITTGDLDRANKYKVMLEEIDAKREAIKALNPKP